MKKLFRIAIYFIVLNLLFGNGQIKEVRTFETLKNPRIFEQLLSEDYSKWKKEKNNVSPNLVSEKRGRRVLGSAYSLSASTKYGNLTKKGIRVRFYGEEDVDTSGLTEAQLRKLKADGIATTGDGYIWINKEKIKDGNTINFNKVVSHEITHQILGEDSEYEARYVESGMEEFLSEIKENGYLKDGKIIDLLYSRLTDEDRARLNRYVLEDMQFKDMIGVDFRYEDKFNVNISKQNKLASEKELRKISKYEEVEKAALEAKRRGKKDKEIEKIYERGIDKIKEEEKYNKDRIINGKEKEFYEYVMKNSNLYTYRIETLAGNNGYYLVNESIGNEEMVPTEMPDSKVTLNEFRRNVLNGNIVYSVGILTTGYGITKEEANRNREIKNGMLLNGLLQTGEGAVKATTGVSAIAGGATGCYYSGGMGCGIGLQMIGSGIVVGGMGINETYVGLQNIGYALSSGSGIRKGTAIEEYNRIRKEKGYIPANNVKINNPVLNYIVNKGGDERDYQVISAVTGAMATELNIYNNYYKKNSIVNYVEKERADREKNKEFKLKSPLEKQMTELGVETERIDLGLKIDGTTRTGEKIDEIMGNNLGRTFKTFDNFDKNTGIATSVKSINLDAKTYQNGSGLSSKIKGNINATLDFDKYYLNGNGLTSSNITKRIVKIVVDDKPLNQLQIENFKKAIDYGKLNNVEVKITINGGK